MRLGKSKKIFEALRIEDVEVSHESDRHVVLLLRILRELEDSTRSGSGGKGSDRGCLNRLSIGYRVGERNTKLKDVRPSSDDCVDDF